MINRRQLLQSMAGGFGAVALSDLLHQNAARGAGEIAPLHFPPRAKHVIFLFMGGGPSHLDLLDPKPELARYAGQRPAAVDLRTERVTAGLMPAPWKFAQCGDSGIEISELLPHLQQCADQLCVVRSMHAVNPNHAPAANFLFSGRIDQIHPSLGSWVSYGLGSENENLPSFVSLKNSSTASRYVRNGYLPGQHQATPVDTSEADPEKMVRYLRNDAISLDDQRHQLEFIQQLNQQHLEARLRDAQLDARIRAMETAFRMQFSAGDALDLASEPEAIRREYGEGWFANGCLVARRLVERGVRYIHLECGGWDDHDKINENIVQHCRQVDQPIAALLADLRRRGLLEETLVVWGGEFGRTPVSENGDGRDHNHYGFTMWLAGGGVRGGHVHGATDEFGFRAIEDRVSVHDLHATILHLLGIDHERLTYRYSGRDFRLTDVHGRVVHEIIS